MTTGSDRRNYETNYARISKFLFSKTEVNFLKDFWIGYNLIYCHSSETKCTEARRKLARTKLIICHLDLKNKQFFKTKILYIFIHIYWKIFILRAINHQNRKKMIMILLRINTVQTKAYQYRSWPEIRNFELFLDLRRSLELWCLHGIIWLIENLKTVNLENCFVQTLRNSSQIWKNITMATEI